MDRSKRNFLKFSVLVPASLVTESCVKTSGVVDAPVEAWPSGWKQDTIRQVAELLAIQDPVPEVNMGFAGLLMGSNPEKYAKLVSILRNWYTTSGNPPLEYVGHTSLRVTGPNWLGDAESLKSNAPSLVQVFVLMKHEDAVSTLSNTLCAYAIMADQGARLVCILPMMIGK